MRRPAIHSEAGSVCRTARRAPTRSHLRPTRRSHNQRFAYDSAIPVSDPRPGRRAAAVRDDDDGQVTGRGNDSSDAPLAAHALSAANDDE